MGSSKGIKIIVSLLRLTLIIAVITSMIYGSWFNLAISLLTLLLTFFPGWFEKRYRIDIPLDFELAGIIFIYASLFLGEINNFYTHFWWWDVLLHFTSATGFACIGFIILFVLFRADKIKSKPFWIVIFSFCFSVSIGVIWEVFEFSMDQVFGFNMQKSGLSDTMWDLIADIGGAGLASLAGYFYMKGEKRFYFYKIIEFFMKDNPRLVKKRRKIK